jgi:hypothetical protein
MACYRATAGTSNDTELALPLVHIALPRYSWSMSQHGALQVRSLGPYRKVGSSSLGQRALAGPWLRRQRL